LWYDGNEPERCRQELLYDSEKDVPYKSEGMKEHDFL